MTYVRLRPGTTYVNVDELPSGTDLYLVGLTARQLHIARSWCFPAARASGRLVRPLGADLYELATDAEVSDYTDDIDGLEDALGGVPQMPSVDYIHLEDQRAQGVAGGTFSPGAWRTRDLNAEVADDGGHCILAGNQFTLGPGTYLIRASCPCHAGDQHQTVLYNVTAAAVEMAGTSENADSLFHVTNRSFISGQFVTTVSTTFEIQHRNTTTKSSDGFGVSDNFGTEVYTVVELWKVA